MGLWLVIILLSVILTGVVVWIITANYYNRKLLSLKEENLNLQNQALMNENIINEVKLTFSQIAQDTLKNQQEALISEHSKDLHNKIDLFKAEEIAPINKLLSEFKESIENYKNSHLKESLEIKNAIATAEKYARALTQNQNTKGEFGEEWLEQILKFANLTENIHYSKQYACAEVKPDFVVNLPNDKHIIIDSKVILKNYIEYCNSDNNTQLKKDFINDITNCINNLSKKNYEEINGLVQPGFILMYIPIEACVSTIYTDYDFRKVIELANSRNIIITGTASLIVVLRLINQLWASQIQYDNVQNIIKVGENLYNNIASHSQILLNIQQTIEKANTSIKAELNRFITRQNGSIFKEAEKLHNFGISSKEIKSGKKITENKIAEEFLQKDGTLEKPVTINT